MAEVRNKCLTIKEFEAVRQGVLNQWPTGKGLALQEAFSYQKKIPKQKRFAERIEEAMVKGEVLTQPRAGVALIDQQILLLKHLEAEGGADLLSATIDSYTRQNRYHEAQKGIEESINAGRSMLNGLPVVNYGVASCRRLTEALNRPLQVRHGTPDARLLAEISLAAGFTAFEGGGISYNIPYAKNVPLEATIYYWQYVDRLAGLYEENGLSVNREPFGPLTGTLVPPCLSNAVAIIEALLAAEQGVKSITVGYGQGGNLIQDVAALRSLKQLVLEYMERYNYKVKITTVFHQWMGGFPPDEAKAFGVIAWGAVAAAFANATKVIVKTPHEAFGIPTKEANADGLKATRQVLNILQGQRITELQALEEETTIITAETKSLLDGVERLGEGDWALGTVRAFAAGVLDLPFAPSKLNRGKVMPIRDQEGAVRFLKHGNLPFTQEIIDFHRTKVSERAKAEKRPVSLQMVIDDIYAIGKGMLVGKPG
ncbi:MAG TPA: methylaspartate mutase subunit E [Firmicutes bacterium]|nr:methylaspartate mutase subunit E [Bacillota bacterium]